MAQPSAAEIPFSFLTLPLMVKQSTLLLSRIYRNPSAELICTCGTASWKAHGSQRTTCERELILSFCHVSSGYWTQVTGLGGN